MPRTGRPNILWIVSEDCPPRFGCYGDRVASTPNLDALAKRGVVFEHAYSAAPVCAPSRFAMVTGIAPESHAPANHMRANAVVPAWLRTYPEVLRDLGYYCTNNVKTDYNASIDPASIWDEWSKEAHWRGRGDDERFLAVFNFDGTHESSVFRPTEPRTDPAAVRLPAYLPDTPEIRADFARYYDKIAEMDRFVGRLLSELAEDGLSEETIVIHSSDHGGVNPRSKRFCYDEGLHVPLIVSAPERFSSLFPEPGSRVSSAVSTIRIPPTLIDLAGGEVPRYMRGASLAGAEFDPAAELAFGMRDRMDERPDMIRTVRDARFRYIRNYLPHRPYSQHCAFGWMAAGYQSWETEHLAGRLNAAQSAFWQAKPPVELYDVEADPDEVSNVAGDPAYADVEQRLAAALREHMLDVHDNGFLPEGSPAEGYDDSRAPGAYPLERIIAVADHVGYGDDDAVRRFTATLSDPDSTVRRWGAIGLLASGRRDPGIVAALAVVLDQEQEPLVVIPCAEALAQAGDDNAVGTLWTFARPPSPAEVRLEAVNALTHLDLDRVGKYREAVAAAADDEDHHVRLAGRYLRFRVDGTYTPESKVFDWSRFAPPPEYANRR